MNNVIKHWKCNEKISQISYPKRFLRNTEQSANSRGTRGKNHTVLKGLSYHCIYLAMDILCGRFMVIEGS